MKKIIKKIPVIGPLAVKWKKKQRMKNFDSSEDYWKERYSTGGNSGEGSYEEFAIHKAEVINDFIEKNGIKSVIEFGSGDGNQLSYFKVDTYTGYEVSPTVVDSCNAKYNEDDSRSFFLTSDYDDRKADLTLSLDVIYCIPEEDMYAEYMKTLFAASSKYVLVFSPDIALYNENLPHLRYRVFTEWVKNNITDFKLHSFVENKNHEATDSPVSDFYFYEKIV